MVSMQGSFIFVIKFLSWDETVPPEEVGFHADSGNDNPQWTESHKENH